VLVVVDANDLRVVAVSENADRLLPHAAAELLGRHVAALAATDARAELTLALSRSDVERHNPLRLTTAGGAIVRVVAHRHDSRILLECETAPDPEDGHVYGAVQGSLVRLRGSTGLRDLCERAATELRELTGFDRVLVYAFQPDWTGEVVAEACARGNERYLGLRFPASDIPSQARALYTACRLRSVPSASYTPAGLLLAPGERPVDLTHAQLRSVSPLHLEYMRNMGVTASLGLSLMDGDRLWGLLTCNHESGAKATSYDVRTACALLGDVVSSLLARQTSLDVAEERTRFLEVQAQLVRHVVQTGDVVEGLTTHSPSLLDVTDSRGAAVFYGSEVHAIGATPPREALLDLSAWLDQQSEDLLVTESLPSIYPPAHAWRDVGCGLVAARIPLAGRRVVTENSWLLWFRPEVVQTIAWGGQPVKRESIEGRLHPRRSFERWQEEVHLKSVPFLGRDIAAAESLAASLSDVILDLEASRKISETAALLDAANRRLRRELEENERVGRALEARTAQLRQREASLQLVLDATGDGLVLVGLDGEVLGERSRGFEQGFGVPEPGARIWDVLFADDAHAAAELAFLWRQLSSARLPFEVAADQLQSDLSHRGRQFAVGYKAVREGARLAAVLVKLEDVTERNAARRAARDANEAQAILAWLLRDPRGFRRTLAELATLAKTAASGPTREEGRRALHTLKGNAAVLGLVTLTERCDRAEERLAERDDTAAARVDLHDVEDELARVVARVEELGGDTALDRSEVPRRELAEAIRQLERGGTVADAVAMLRRWTLEPAAGPLGKLAAHARRLAGELGKEVEVVVQGGDVRFDGGAYEPLWCVLAHAVANAVDHGIEPSVARVADGKTPCGRIVLGAEASPNGGVAFVVSDDGRGVDWEAVRDRARNRGLPYAAPSDVVQALFADAVSTRTDAATAISGRGVGLAALHATAKALGGSVDLTSEPRVGTRLRVHLPAPNRSG